MALSDRIKSARERIQRREQSTRADRRASARRVEREEPETAGERVQVQRKKVSEGVEESTSEARELASDAKQLIETELGVSESEASGIISEGAALLESAGDDVEDLDFDGDGDTDILSATDPLEGGGFGSGEFDGESTFGRDDTSDSDGGFGSESFENGALGDGSDIPDPTTPVFEPDDNTDGFF